MRLGDVPEAIKAFSRAATLEPQHYEAHRALGFLWLSQGERGRALDHLARTYELRRGDDRTTIALKSLTTATRAKLEHDAEQFLHLSQRTRDGLRFEQLARNYRAMAEQMPRDVAALSDAQIDALGDDYNTPIHLRAAPEVAGGALNERADGPALTAQFERQGAASVDDLLTPRRSTCRSGSCWRAPGTTSAISTALSRPISKTDLPVRSSCRSWTSSGRVSPEILGEYARAKRGPSKACGRRRPWMFTPTMPSSASISGSPPPKRT